MGNDLSLDATLELLADRRRRALLNYLEDGSDRTASMAELVEHLGERERTRTGDRPDPDRVEADLHHVHLPKLDEYGVVEYDERSGDVRYWPDDRLSTYLELVGSVEPDPSCPTGT